MKICDITQSFNESSGGIRTYIKEKQKFIQFHSDCEHVLITAGDRDSYTRKSEMSVYTIQSPVIPGCAPYRLLWRMDKIYRVLEKEKPDIVEFADPYFMAWSALRFRTHRRSRVLGFYHTDISTAYPRLFADKIGIKSLNPLIFNSARSYVCSLYNRCDATICASKIVSDRLEQLGVDNIHRISFGVDFQQFSAPKYGNGIRGRLQILPEEVLFIYAGRFDSEKRVDVLTEAFSGIPDSYPAKLVLVGDGVLKPRLLAIAERNPRIIILPFVDKKQELADLLSAANVYVTAGPFETFGLSVAEAQAAGLPVIGVNGGALPERISPQNGMLAAVDDVADLREKMVRMMMADREQMGRFARLHAEKNYSWESTFGRLFELYESLLIPNNLSVKSAA